MGQNKNKSRPFRTEKISYGSYLEVKIQLLCSSTVYIQNVSISLRFSDYVHCRRGYYFRAWVLYFSFATCKDVKYLAIMFY